MKARFTRITREAVGCSGVILLFFGYLCFQAAYPATIAKGAATTSAVDFLNDFFTSHHLKIVAVTFGILGCLCLIVMIVTTGKGGRVVIPWSKADQDDDTSRKTGEESE